VLSKVVGQIPPFGSCEGRQLMMGIIGEISHLCERDPCIVQSITRFLILQCMSLLVIIALTRHFRSYARRIARFD
jgi:hypothetical protein